METVIQRRIGWHPRFGSIVWISGWLVKGGEILKDTYWSLFRLKEDDLAEAESQIRHKLEIERTKLER